VKRTIVFIGLIGCFLMAAVICVQPVSAQDKQEKAELVPMELDGTEWAIKFTIVNENGEKEYQEDQLIFKGKKFISELYEKKGYQPTNYSLSVSERDVTSFGTMQIKDKETSFWKGEVVDENISGSLHVQYPEGGNETKYYKGTLSGGTLKRRGETVKSKPAKKPAPKPAAQEGQVKTGTGAAK